jgi:hypothetical protein
MDSIQANNLLDSAGNIEAILNSLDGVKRAEAPPFIYTRIQSRLNSTTNSVFETITKLFTKPVTIVSFLFLVLFMDIIVYKSAFNVHPGKSDPAPSEFFAGDLNEEMLFYELPGNDYAYGYGTESPVP